jgi:hypothetical protein
MWGDRLSKLKSSLIIDTEMYQVSKTIFTHGSESASPPDRSEALFPIVVQYLWSDRAADHTMNRQMRKQTDRILVAVQAEGQNPNAPVYVNYALHVNDTVADTPLTNIYGDNLKRLNQIRKEIDPDDVMALTGGFKF